MKKKKERVCRICRQIYYIYIYAHNIYMQYAERTLCILHTQSAVASNMQSECDEAKSWNVPKFALVSFKVLYFFLIVTFSEILICTPFIVFFLSTSLHFPFHPRLFNFSRSKSCCFQSPFNCNSHHSPHVLQVFIHILLPYEHFFVSLCTYANCVVFKNPHIADTSARSKKRDG